ncbi:cupin domain-containing protein [Azospirillum brasilense]|uniref:cupin domain-containing protein n=1 Tax=Azospirillum brasilense TaxID=192 RepID=UPI0030B8E51B
MHAGHHRHGRLALRGVLRPAGRAGGHHPRDGAPQEHGEGDAFVIPRGFTGVWEVRETIRKYYAIEKPLGPRAAVRQMLRTPLSLARRLLRRGEPALARGGF